MTEAAQHMSNRHWLEIFENATEPMLVIDPKGEIYEANEATLKTVGYSKG